MSLIAGAQYKITVEYAPSPRVPKLSTKKDVREGTIYKGVNSISNLHLIMWKTLNTCLDNLFCFY